MTVLHTSLEYTHRDQTATCWSHTSTCSELTAASPNQAGHARLASLWAPAQLLRPTDVAVSAYTQNPTQGLRASVVAAGASALVRLMLRLAFSAAALALSGCWKILLKPSLSEAPKPRFVYHALPADTTASLATGIAWEIGTLNRRMSRHANAHMRSHTTCLAYTIKVRSGAFHTASRHARYFWV